MEKQGWQKPNAADAPALLQHYTPEGVAQEAMRSWWPLPLAGMLLLTGAWPLAAVTAVAYMVTLLAAPLVAVHLGAFTGHKVVKWARRAAVAVLMLAFLVVVTSQSPADPAPNSVDPRAAAVAAPYSEGVLGEAASLAVSLGPQAGWDTQPNVGPFTILEQRGSGWYLVEYEGITLCLHPGDPVGTAATCPAAGSPPEGRFAGTAGQQGFNPVS